MDCVDEPAQRPSWKRLKRVRLHARKIPTHATPHLINQNEHTTLLDRVLLVHYIKF